jgi:signal peptidase I
MAKESKADSKSAKAGRRGDTIVDWIKTAAISLAIVITFRGVVAQAYQIPSGSMENTLLVGDFLYINKMLYGSEIDLGFGGKRFFYHRFPAIRQPKPGDIIVFRYPVNPRQDYIKRCVAVAGQTIELKNKVLYVDGV